jgi:N-acetylglucosamine-6-phosphate deacetylase
MANILFKNARIITPTGITDGDVSTSGYRIAGVFPGGAPAAGADRTVDAAGRYLSPGFIDIHTHGAGGADFMDGSLESIYTVCRAHLEHGTTSIVPTTITSTRESLMEFVDLFNQVELKRPGHPEILGLHLEGPYFAMEQRGAQDPQFMRDPRPDEYEEVVRRTDRVIRWSFAVELDGAMDFLRFLREHGIVSSVAHSDATCRQVMDAYDNGVRALTHFYSGMAGVRRINAYRVAGAIEAGYLIDGMYVEVISDGKHLPADLLQLIYKVKGPDRICLVSDSMRGAGMPDGPSMLGHPVTGVPCIIEDGVAKMPDRTAFAGSVATADRLVRTMRSLAGIPLHEAVAMMTVNPARLVGADATKGSIAVGMDADLLLFDDDVTISLVMARGEIVKE